MVPAYQSWYSVCDCLDLECFQRSLAERWAVQRSYYRRSLSPVPTAVLVLWEECVSLTSSLMQASAPPPLEAGSSEMIVRRKHVHRFISTDLCSLVVVESHRKPVLVQFVFITQASQVQERTDDVALVMDACLHNMQANTRSSGILTRLNVFKQNQQ